MEHHILRIVLTVIVVVSPPLICIGFNRYIDQRAGKRWPGETAVWVGLGVGGVLLCAIIVTALWWHLLPQDWTGALWAGAIYVAMFIPSGLVMWRGDKVRFRVLRRIRGVQSKINGEQ